MLSSLCFGWAEAGQPAGDLRIAPRLGGRKENHVAGMKLARAGNSRWIKSRFLMANPDSPGYYAPLWEGKAYLLFLRGGQLLAQPFDAEKGAVHSEPVAIAERLQTGASFSASENGVLIFGAVAAHKAGSRGSTGRATARNSRGCRRHFQPQNLT